MLSGLRKPQKAVASRWLYDERGSLLFEDITQLDEYYPTRAEIDILASRASEIARFCPTSAVVIEYGAGAAVKTEILLEALLRPRVYAPIDIAASFLEQTAERLRLRFPAIRITPIVADFTNHVTLPADIPETNRVGFFPGATIGNLDSYEVGIFLRAMRRHVGSGGMALIGIDLPKSLDVLLPAYDDGEGVTAEFNRNLLRRINRELDGDFDIASFAHEARWNALESAVEMHLVSTVAQTVSVEGRAFTFARGESIHTESCRKHAVDDVSMLAARHGWRIERVWTDRCRQYAMIGMHVA